MFFQTFAYFIALGKSQTKLNLQLKSKLHEKTRTKTLFHLLEIIYSNTIIIIMNKYNFSQIFGTKIDPKKIQTQINNLFQVGI